MKIYDLANNSLFLRNWRERMRMQNIASYLLIFSLVVVLIITYSYLAPASPGGVCPRGGGRTLSTAHDPAVSSVLGLCILQQLIILLFAVFSAYKAAESEKTGGTLDFHRASPTKINRQVLGLLLGSVCMEWFLFFVNFLIIVILALIKGVPILPILNFEISLIICALFFHSFAVFVGMFGNSKNRNVGAAQLFGIMYLFSALMAVSHISFIYHLTWLPGYDQLQKALTGNESFLFGPRNYNAGSEYSDLSYMIFGFKVNSLILQIIVQVPLLALFASAVGRRILSPERPAITKSQAVCTVLFVLFLYSGSSFSSTLMGLSRAYEFNIYPYLVGILGVFGAYIITPSKLLFLKGLRKAKRSGIKKTSWSDDNSTNAYWVLMFGVIAVMLFAFYAILFKLSLKEYIVCSFIIVSYPAFFAFFLEWFNFSQYYKKTIIFLSILIIFWAVVPFIGFTLKDFFYYNFNVNYFSAFSPFTGLYLVSLMLSPSNLNFIELLPVLQVTFIMLFSAWLLSYLQRIEIKKDIWGK
ncbi:MAG: hypothetical protein HQL27_01770 [Candidatus Omnitrophica bacterium]|nr:hypothetical protein [Candidatus Omnitrophota bacterium]